MDFHWGEYTYNLEGGSTIFLSELLEILAENGGEDAPADPATLKALAKDMSKVKNVTFTDP